MKKRLITGAVILAIFIPLVAVKVLFPLFQICMMALAAFASYEMINLFEHRHKFPIPARIVIILSTIVVFMAFLTEYKKQSIEADGLVLFDFKIGLIPMLLIVVIILLALMVMYKDFNGASIGRALTSIVYPAFGFATLTLLRASGIEFIVYLFLITMLTDTFAYLFGMMLGKHKMSPNISPKKTWEGAIGGTLTAVIVASLFALFYNKIFSDAFSDNFSIFRNVAYLKHIRDLNKPCEVIFAVALTIFASIMGQIGDLVASKFKRTYEIKDFSDIFPGHGGVLDRFDSAIYAGMFVWAIFQLLS